MTEPITLSALGLDLSPRVLVSKTVVASPTDSTETIIASVTIPANLTIVTGVLIVCQAAFTVGTNGVSALLRVKQTNTSGTAVATTGAITQTAANLDSSTAVGLDTAPAAGQIYKATLTVASASAGSTVAAVTLLAIVV